MADLNKCLFDESIPQGTDYTSSKKVKSYDEKMTRFRDYAKEAEQIAEALSLKAHENVLEIGCETGGLTVPLTRSCAWITALDVSKPMLDYARKKARTSNVHNVTFAKGGFLSHGQENGSFDAVLTNAALHHLPDFWKMAALLKINRLLREDGRFFLGDVIFNYPPEQYKERSFSWIGQMTEAFGSSGAKEAETHLKEEYSTFGWIIEGMLERTGFEWERVGGDDYYGRYKCRKVKDFPE